jgi:hypothetical protein
MEPKAPIEAYCWEATLVFTYYICYREAERLLALAFLGHESAMELIEFLGRPR